MGSHESVIELEQEKAENPLEFLRVLKYAFQNRGSDKSKFNVTHLYVFILCLNSSFFFNHMYLLRWFF